MDKWKFHTIIGLVGFALFGLIYVQSEFIRQSSYVQEQFFNQFVEEAMLRVVVNMEEQEAYHYYNNMMPTKGNDYTANIQNKGINESYSLSFQNDTFSAQILKDDSLYIVNATNLPTLNQKIENLKLGFNLSTNEQSDLKQFLEFNPNTVFNQMNFQVSYAETTPHLATDSTDLHQLILYELKRAGINTPFQFALLEDYSLQKILSNCTQEITPQFLKNAYKTKLYINNFAGNQAFLLLNFPKKKTFLFKSNSKLLMSSAVFIFLVLVAFAFSWYIIFRQKKLSELKTDFINNMTHELKTPVATISLATEMLSKEKVQQDPQKINNYTNVIKEENIRLGNHIEKVLQTAQLHKESIRLNKENIDLHHLLSELQHKFALRFADVNAKISWQLNAQNTQVFADKIHLLNVLSSLTDNALKYKKEGAPTIEINTQNQNEHIVLKIKDYGIGMTKADAKRIFEKFYRVPTGDIHNVKGFGLGLSYVKTMVEQHNGIIEINSELGKFTEFTLKLPNK